MIGRKIEEKSGRGRSRAPFIKQIIKYTTVITYKELKVLKYISRG